MLNRDPEFLFKQHQHQKHIIYEYHQKKDNQTLATENESKGPAQLMATIP